MPGILRQTLPAFLAGAALLACQPTLATARDVVDHFDFDLAAGQRIDQLNWNIAGDASGQNPDVLSELTWKDLKSRQVSAQGKLVMLNPRFTFGGVVRGGGNYGEIRSGANQDSDYNGDGRTLEFSRSDNQANAGTVWDASLGGGMVFFNRSRTFSLSPLVGFSVHQQKLTMRDGYQTVNDPANTPAGVILPAIGPFADLNSTYNSRWRSGWLGVDVDYAPVSFFDFHATAELHAGRYEAEADWNLRADFQHPTSFSQTADRATGLVGRAGIRLGARNLFLTLDYQYQKWRAKDGLDQTYLNNGTVGETKLNQVNWEATSLNGGVTVRF